MSYGSWRSGLLTADVLTADVDAELKWLQARHATEMVENNSVWCCVDVCDDLTHTQRQWR